MDGFTCVFCGNDFEGEGLGTDPLCDEGECCEACFLQFVIPARMQEMIHEREDDDFE